MKKGNSTIEWSVSEKYKNSIVPAGVLTNLKMKADLSVTVDASDCANSSANSSSRSKSQLRFLYASALMWKRRHQVDSSVPIANDQKFTTTQRAAFPLRSA
ncbi:hypothetical protein TNIN_185361 [Trichonephila inaurata madagascariensis]|uniref:Uncharacterized protein n=1 Tax=Trichonephila inaurata madagascariensis TaxID=2747483 RepID=A0A8X6YLF7_9ARAC|nr:hypothetical protein TNIN_185361 [Trichonephila inaurata madagascariensis]